VHHLDNPMNKAWDYQLNARRCDRRAAVAESETDRDCWALLAEAWLKLADKSSLHSRSTPSTSFRRLIAAGSSI
jgi:hypothetical protein